MESIKAKLLQTCVFKENERGIFIDKPRKVEMEINSPHLMMIHCAKMKNICISKDTLYLDIEDQMEMCIDYEKIECDIIKTSTIYGSCSTIALEIKTKIGIILQLDILYNIRNI